MTTVACDGHTIAADGRIVLSGVIITDAGTKLYQFEDGSILGGAGDMDDFRDAYEALSNNVDPVDYAGGKDFSAIRMYPSGAIAMYSAALRPTFVNPPVAIGSGGDIALGAMLAGKSARQAVKLAATRDMGTGPVIYSHKRR